MITSASTSFPRLLLVLIAGLALSPCTLAIAETDTIDRSIRVEAARRDAAPRPGTGAGENVMLLYKAADIASARFNDEGVSAATHILEQSMKGQGYDVRQPDPDTQAILAKGPRTLVSFSPDAGLSVLLSAKRRDRPSPGEPNHVRTEVSLTAKVYCGSVLQPSPPEVTGMMTALRSAIGKGYEAAAKRAANELAQTLRASLSQRQTACEGALERMIRDYRTIDPEPAQAPTPTGPLPSPKRVWAILVGISDFSEAARKSGLRINNLPGVTRDISLMRSTLLARGVPQSNIIQLTDKAASASNFRQQLRSLQGRAERDDLILVYLSSHGLPADIREGTAERPSLSGYGLPVFHDFNPQDANTILDFWEIQSLLLNTRAQQVVWMVDTCHAGGATLGLMGSAGGTRPENQAPEPTDRLQIGARGLQRVDAASAVFNPEQVAQAAGQVASGRHFAVLSAATPEQLALEAGNGLFTASVAQGLARNNLPIAIEQLFRDFVEQQVQAEARKRNHTQRPVFGKSGRGGEIQL